MASKAKKPAKSKPVKQKPTPAKSVKSVAKKASKPPVVVERKPAKSLQKAKPAPAVEPAPSAKTPAPKKIVFSAKERELFKGNLLKLRERVTSQITFLANDSLNRADETPAEDRTDDFDREFALSLVSSEHDALFEIDEALRRLKEGVYGACEMCTAPIEKPRLNALPFAKMCVKCQSQSERGRSRFRPFGTTIFQAEERASESAPAEEPE